MRWTRPRASVWSDFSQRFVQRCKMTSKRWNQKMTQLWCFYNNQTFVGRTLYQRDKNTEENKSWHVFYERFWCLVNSAPVLLNVVTYSWSNLNVSGFSPSTAALTHFFQLFLIPPCILPSSFLFSFLHLLPPVCPLSFLHLASSSSVVFFWVTLKQGRREGGFGRFGGILF